MANYLFRILIGEDHKTIYAITKNYVYRGIFCELKSDDLLLTNVYGSIGKFDARRKANQ